MVLSENKGQLWPWPESLDLHVPITSFVIPSNARKRKRKTELKLKCLLEEEPFKEDFLALRPSHERVDSSFRLAIVGLISLYCTLIVLV